MEPATELQKCDRLAGTVARCGFIAQRRQDDVGRPKEHGLFGERVLCRIQGNIRTKLMVLHRDRLAARRGAARELRSSPRVALSVR
jgi:hypothetical protein